MYKWMDESGVIHFSDQPHRGDASPEAIETRPTTRSRPERPAVELYSTSWCPYCKNAREFLRSRGIPFVEYDVEKDRDAARRKMALDKRRGVPFAMINGKPVHGFSETLYEQALRKRP
jgi:glutaredoxin